LSHAYAPYIEKGEIVSSEYLEAQGIFQEYNADWEPFEQKTECTQFEHGLDAVLDKIKKMLIDKNRKYGNSALEPKRVFSKASPQEQLRVRMDDKISRLMSGQCDEDEDVIEDLLGYLILFKMSDEKV
jgi:hypothetical protein